MQARHNLVQAEVVAPRILSRVIQKIGQKMLDTISTKKGKRSTKEGLYWSSIFLMVHSEESSKFRIHINRINYML